ncbi:YybH family protein [Paraburkholderia sp. 2C]
MQRISLCTAALAACVSFSAFAAPALADRSPRPPEAAIKAENARWAEAFARGDDEAIGRLYTKDGALLPPGGERITGAAAIASYFAKGNASAASDTVSFSHAEFYGNDQAVTEVSDVEIRDRVGRLKFRGKQTLVFLRQNGAWKLHRDMWNASATVNADGR